MSELLTPAERAETVLRWDETDSYTALCWVKNNHPEAFDGAAAAVGRVHELRAGGRTLAGVDSEAT